MKFFLALFLLLLGAVCTIEASSLKVLQINIWQEGANVENGFEAIVDAVVQADADVVFFNEVYNAKGKRFVLRMLGELKQRNRMYYGLDGPRGVAVLAKYPITDRQVVFPKDKSNGSIVRVAFEMNGRTFAAYSAHLDYRHYACYLPRGYNGTTWEKMDEPVVDVDSILRQNRLSHREEAIAAFIEAVQKDLASGSLILLAGDFNEPSHLDWQENTKNLWEHHGVTVNWDCSSMLYRAGFKDAYRVLHPNPVTHPGFTFPSDNEQVDIKKLTWAPDTDERERIDFIYYYPDKKNLIPVKAVLMGPKRSIVRGRRVEETGCDIFIEPTAGWPTDHKAVMVEFKVW
ncbi:endonuclease/exonuclease/phosphatase family protein [Bacteroides sp.]